MDIKMISICSYVLYFILKLHQDCIALPYIICCVFCSLDVLTYKHYYTYGGITKAFRNVCMRRDHASASLSMCVFKCCLQQCKLFLFTDFFKGGFCFGCWHGSSLSLTLPRLEIRCCGWSTVVVVAW